MTMMRWNREAVRKGGRMPKYWVWFKGFVEIEAETEEEAVKKAEALLYRRKKKLEPPAFPEAIDVYLVG